MRQLLVIILLISGAQAWAQAQRGSTEEEFEIKKTYLKKRYEDFFVRENEADKRDVRRQSAAGQQKEARQAIREAYEKARKDFIANRKEKPVVSDEEHNKELEAQKLAHEKARKEYIRRQNDLNKIEASTGVIPDWIEYRLYEAFETTDETPGQ